MDAAGARRPRVAQGPPGAAPSSDNARHTGRYTGVSPDNVARIIATIGRDTLCEACISLTSGVPRAAVPGYMNGMRNTGMVSAEEALCHACQQRRVVYRKRAA
jgi:hypothetical protein